MVPTVSTTISGRANGVTEVISIIVKNALWNDISSRLPGSSSALSSRRASASRTACSMNTTVISAASTIHDPVTATAVAVPDKKNSGTILTTDSPTFLTATAGICADRSGSGR